MNNKRLKRAGYDVIVVGSGPNGLGAAISAALHGLHVLLIESANEIGGGLRSAPLTLPGFIHDVCSAIHPMAAASPFFQSLPLQKHGLTWLKSPAPLAHPLDQKSVILEESISDTILALKEDGALYQTLFQPLIDQQQELLPQLLQPLLRWPQNPMVLARFGALGLLSAHHLIHLFKRDETRALLGGIAGHTILPFHRVGTAAMTLVLTMVGHLHGWPFPRTGAQALANALGKYYLSLGGELLLNTPVKRLHDLPPARATLLDVSPINFATLLQQPLPTKYMNQLTRYKHGNGIFKVDYALSAPVPWRDPKLFRAATIHLGGNYKAIQSAEAQVAQGRLPAQPYVLAAQPSLFDDTRAPAGQHTFWAYMHVPRGSSVDCTGLIEQQIERFAPGFRDVVIARYTRNAQQYHTYNPNYIGGDISGGEATLRQLIARPVLSPSPYRTPIPGVYLCSASTPPGGGVHGMCGYHAFQTAYKDLFQ